MRKIPLGFSRNGLSMRLPSAVPVGSSPALRAKQKAKRAEDAKKLAERSERKRLKAILKKFGPEKALELGVPRDMVDAAARAAAREMKRVTK